MMYQLRKQPFLMSSRNAPRVTTLKTAARETRERGKDTTGTRSTLRCDLLSF